MARACKDYSLNVFINCPYDDRNLPLLHAITFTVRLAGFIPRSALEKNDSGEVRLHRLYDLIEQCQFGIHDVSRIEGARHNMPFECGLFYGALKFGKGHHARKQLLVLESVEYESKQSLSDLSGVDCMAHHGNEAEAIRCVMHFFDGKNGSGTVKSTRHAQELYGRFKVELPPTAAHHGYDSVEVQQLRNWRAFSHMADGWLAKNLPSHMV
jgi:hypothetical protein